MKGWKTWTAAGIVALSAILKFMGYEEVAGAILALGGSLGLVGLGHKIEKKK